MFQGDNYVYKPVEQIWNMRSIYQQNQLVKVFLVNENKMGTFVIIASTVSV